MSVMLSRRQALMLGLGSIASMGLAACGGGGAADGSGSYKIVTDTLFAPFEFADASGKMVGIDMDLFAAIAEDQGFEYTMESVGFQTALEYVKTGQADGVIAGMSITEERAEIFDFSDPYYDSTVCAAALASSSVASLDDLKGQKVAVKNGTQSSLWAESIAGQYGFETVTFDDSATMYQDVSAGNSACCFEDTPVMSFAIAQFAATDGAEGVDFKIIGEDADEFATPSGFAIVKDGNAELLEKFNKGLANIKASGKYDEIVASYLG